MLSAPESAIPTPSAGDGKRDLTRSQIFELVAAWLRPVISMEPARVPDIAMPWETIAEAASYHFVSPALGCTIGSDPLLPEKARDYFQVLLELNRERNEVIVEGLTGALRALNDVGIQPVLLKGAALLTENAYRDRGMRVMQDIDLLVPDARLQDASNAIVSAGFDPKQDSETPAGHHHLPIQVHRETGLGIELHRELSEDRWCPLVDARRCFDGAMPVAVGDGAAMMMNPTDRVAHIVVHAQLSDDRHRRGVPQLRQLLDLAVLRTRHEAGIDWHELETRFRTNGELSALTDMLAWASHLFGQPSPFANHAQDRMAVERMRRAIDGASDGRPGQRFVWLIQQGWSVLTTDPRRFVTAVRRGRWKSAKPPRW
jgi:hypothetical protein